MTLDRFLHFCGSCPRTTRNTAAPSPATEPAGGPAHSEVVQAKPQPGMRLFGQVVLPSGTVSVAPSPSRQVSGWGCWASGARPLPADRHSRCSGSSVLGLLSPIRGTGRAGRVECRLQVGPPHQTSVSSWTT